MAITTVDQSNPYLQRYGGLSVSADLAAQLAQQQMNANMMGMDAFGGVQVPQEGDNLLEFLANLSFAGQDQYAAQIADFSGIPTQDYAALIQQINNNTEPDSDFRHFLRGVAQGGIEHNPLLLASAGIGLSGLGGVAGASSGASGAGAGGAAGAGTAGTLGGTTGSFINAAGDLVVTGAAPTLGAGAGIGAGLGGLGAASLLGGTAPGVQGPPEPAQGPPEPAGGVAAGAGATGAAAGLGGLGLPGWLAVGAAAAQGLQGSPDVTTSSTNAPPAYLQPYLSQAAQGAQQQYAQGPYVAPIQQSAIDYGQNVLNGNYLNSNPYLDATFNRAAGAVTNQVQSNFGLAGRNARGPDAQGLATDKYSDLANLIYGGNYQAERDRMQAIVPQATQLGAVTNPGSSLDDYIARLRNLAGGNSTSTTSTPTQNNWLSGLAGLGLVLAQPGG